MKVELTKEQQQLVVVAIMWVGGGGWAYGKYFWGPTSEKNQELETKVEATQRKIARAKGQAGKLNRINRELVRINEEAAQAEKQLPKDVDYPGVLDKISLLSRRHNVRIASFSSPRRTNRQHFEEVSYELRVSATYHDLGLFLASIALEERIFNVRNIKYTSTGETEGPLNILMELISYKYKG